MAEYWWKNAIIYAVDVDRFFDSNGDGIGDFKGLASKLDYIQNLGVTCIWLLPFYPSTDRDNGYDITDYFRVHTRYGLFEDFLAFVRAAGERGIRVILDLVTHHTSDHHPWFQAARHDKRSPYRDYYYWTDHPPATPPGKGPMFPGEEETVWTFDEVAGAYYHHRFYHFQPGLNHANPKVRSQIEEIIDYWLSFGISGFRIDAASHMVERPVGPEPVDPSHSVLRHIYRHATEGRQDVLLMGEVDEEPARLKSFFDGEQLNAMFNFLLNNYLILALATGSPEAVRRGMALLPQPPINGQWANFLRNLDEADLERLDEGEMEAVLAAFAPRPEMRIYGRGIRRRLAPMLSGDVRRLKMAYSLLFSLPGSPVIAYGDEIGMGDDLRQHARNAVRSPMQWSRGRNGGFSTAATSRLSQPAISSGRFGYRSVNVEEQDERPDSLLNFIRRLCQVRRARGEIGVSHGEFLDCAAGKVLAIRYRSGDSSLLVVHNLGGSAARCTIDRAAPAAGRQEALIGDPVDIGTDGRLDARLAPYDTRWIAIGG